jgi:hypothetical protein
LVTGLKTIEKVVEPPAAILVEAWVLIEKSPAFVPEMETGPLLLNVADCVPILLS